MSSNILVFEAHPRPRRGAWLVSAYGGEWEDKYERPLAVYATKGEAIMAAEAYEAEGHDDLYCDGCAEGAYVYEIEGENYDGPIDPTCEMVPQDEGFRCPACGTHHDMSGFEEFPWPRCHECGARVVGADE